MSAATAGVATSAGSLIGVVVMIQAGVLVDRMGPHKKLSVVRSLCYCCAAVTGALALGPIVMSGVIAAIAVLATVLELATVGLLQSAVVAEAIHTPGRATGTMLTGHYAGAFLAPALFGALADTDGGYRTGWAICGVLIAVGATLFALYPRLAVPAVSRH
jgi:MFS family permease